MIIDTHSHVHSAEFDTDRDEVLERAVQAGVDTIVLIGENIEDSRRAVGFARANSLFHVVAGVHPHKASEWNAAVAGELTTVLADDSVVGLGEIGLDFHYDFSPREQQYLAFREQLELAHAQQFPIVIHCREAYEEVLGIFRELPSTPLPVRGVMHCYFGTVDQANELISLGFMLGIGGSSTFKKAEELHRVITDIPLEYLVLETDAPYMAPVPHRGKRNEPAFLPLVVRRIGELKGREESDVLQITRKNAFSLFPRLHKQARNSKRE